MKRTTQTVAFLVILSAFVVTITVLPEARATILYVGGAGPGNYTSIQAAIDDANPGDTVFVHSGRYYENVVVNKTLTLAGEDRDVTIVDAGRNDHAIHVTADWVNITGLTATNSSSSSPALKIYFANECHVGNVSISSNDNHGVLLEYSDGCAIISNTISKNSMNGIILWGSKGTIVANNTLSANEGFGIYMHSSEDSNFANNVMVDDGIAIQGGLLQKWNTHTIDTTNTVNGKPLYYWKNAVGGTVPSGAGQVILANSTGVTVKNQDISHTSVGIELGFSSYNNITNNTVSENTYGIWMHSSNSNTLTKNTISLSTQYGIGIDLAESPASRNNTIYHNNLIDNQWQAKEVFLSNQWDDGYPSGGNYWSDYTGSDLMSGPNQDQPGSDDMGDTPYLIGFWNEDRYPLMAPTTLIPPRPPEALQANLSGLNSENVTLTWSISPDDGEGFRSVIGYRIFRASTYDSQGTGYVQLASLPNGTSSFVDNLAGEGDSSNYFYLVCASDMDNGTACAANQVGKFTGPLSQGPNLVSIPLIQSNDSIETVLQAVKYDKAWFFDSSSKEWKWYMPSKTYRRGLWNMDHTDGMWVNITGDCNLTVAGIVPAQTTIHLYEGWNLVSFPSLNTSYSVSDLKGEIGANRVEGYDPAPPNFLRVLGDADVLQAGFGYWVRVETVTDWTVEVS